MTLVKNLKFSIFYFSKIGQENVFNDILERRKAFLDSKIAKLRKSKIWYFSKGVGPLSIFFFLKKNRPGKCVRPHSRKEKSVLRL